MSLQTFLAFCLHILLIFFFMKMSLVRQYVIVVLDTLLVTICQTRPRSNIP